MAGHAGHDGPAGREVVPDWWLGPPDGAEATTSGTTPQVTEPKAELKAPKALSELAADTDAMATRAVEEAQTNATVPFEANLIPDPLDAEGYDADGNDGHADPEGTEDAWPLLPVPYDAHQRNRRERQRRFLLAYVEEGNTYVAAKTAGMKSPMTHWNWVRTDPDYQARWREAEFQIVQLLEAEAFRRAVTGVDEPVFFKGDQVGTVRRYSDTLLTLLLKAHAPERYRERITVIDERSTRAEIARLEDEIARVNPQALEKLKALEAASSEVA